MLSELQFRILAREFKAVHGILYIVGTIDGLHIAILVPMIGREDYYCEKLFHLVIFQGIVNRVILKSTAKL